MLTKIIPSNIDESVNFITHSDVGFFESRFVRRTDDYFIIYLSAQSGCDQACRMCHLTATGQTEYVNASVQDLINQALPVLDHYKANRPALKVHINFMARGEPLNNPIVCGESQLFTNLSNTIKPYSPGIEIKYNISTILPKTFENESLFTRFAGDIKPNIYYSLYSVNPAFRKKWLGKAMDPRIALDKLAEYELHNYNVQNKIHFAFIEGENDSEEDMYNMIELLTQYDLRCKMNVVRYNPHSDKYGKESSEEVIDRNVVILRSHFGDHNVKVIPRVGMDVKASCGMFIS